MDSYDGPAPMPLGVAEGYRTEEGEVGAGGWVRRGISLLVRAHEIGERCAAMKTAI